MVFHAILSKKLKCYFNIVLANFQFVFRELISGARLLNTSKNKDFFLQILNEEI